MAASGHIYAIISVKSSKLPNQHEQLFQKYALSFFKSVWKATFEQINDHMQSKFSKHLTGFRKNHSTQNALLVVTEKWKTIFNKNLKVGALFMDLSKAFYTLDHSLLLAKLSMVLIIIHWALLEVI